MSRRVGIKDQEALDLEALHSYGISSKTRTIFMNNEVDSDCAANFMKNMLWLESSNSEPITIILNNTGGEENDGLAIYDTIANSPCEVTVKVFGSCMSMASVILQAADRRVMSRNSRIMIHYGTSCSADYAAECHAKINYNWVEESKKFDKLMEKIFLDKIHQKHPDFKLSKLQKMLDFDTILDAEQSLNLNLIDEII